VVRTNLRDVPDSHPDEYPKEPEDALFKRHAAIDGRHLDLAPEEVWDVHDE
jgi:hypothetical protein